MNRRFVMGSALSVAAVAVAGLGVTTLTAQESSPVVATASPSDAVPANRQMTIWRDPGCGCCDAYADYMEENGYVVTRVDDRDFDKRSIEVGVPENGLGCHLAQVDGYYVSGLVPAEIVDRLTTERPEIIGITLPGMPQNAPGMAGKNGPLKTFAFGKDGVSVYADE
ncbi:DUF411 domain-containing protein [Loktanella sp. M215]|uniref:DUF411 domain-containing protein n=1 Tax=Loktanella sp. M215 TaxID=2675431 RepID=UPI001F2E7294|nr:DUF411 domain-containing protein [Loktanella sp. M215]MCF7702041.1 metal-binding protein [Loktanella sp. M215]